MDKFFDDLLKKKDLARTEIKNYLVNIVDQLLIQFKKKLIKEEAILTKLKGYVFEPTISYKILQTIITQARIRKIKVNMLKKRLANQLISSIQSEFSVNFKDEDKDTALRIYKKLGEEQKIKDLHKCCDALPELKKWLEKEAKKYREKYRLDKLEKPATIIPIEINDKKLEKLVKKLKKVEQEINKYLTKMINKKIIDFEKRNITEKEFYKMIPEYTYGSTDIQIMIFFVLDIAKEKKVNLPHLKKRYANHLFRKLKSNFYIYSNDNRIRLASKLYEEIGFKKSPFEGIIEDLYETNDHLREEFKETPKNY